MQLSDHELVALQGQIGDPDQREAVKAEERRRVSEKALRRAKTSNWIATASLVIATGSLTVSIITMLLAM